jgi:hypothetical protein
VTRLSAIIVGVAISFGGFVFAIPAAHADPIACPTWQTAMLGTNQSTGLQEWVCVDNDQIPSDQIDEHTTFTAGPNDSRSGCWDVTETYNQYNLVHVKMWRFSLHSHWCGNFGIPLIPAITSADKGIASMNIYAAGGAWSYRGIQEPTDLVGYYGSCCGTGFPNTAHGEYATGEFQLCVGPVCVQTKFPHVWIHAHYDGGYVANVCNACDQT